MENINKENNTSNEKNNKNKEILFYVVGMFTLAIIILAYLLFSPKNSIKAKVFTDRGEYKIGNALKVDIENHSTKDICFSSCFPYYFERKDGVWEKYKYGDCPQDNIAENCVAPNKIKAFELNIPPIDKGIHRLAVPACIGCAIKDKFRDDKWFYSNEFTVK